MHLNLGVAVDQFFGDDSDSDDLQLHVTPGTHAEFVFSIADLTVRIYDRFSLQRDRKLLSFSPDAIDTGDFWTNTAGISALYPISDSLSVHGVFDISRDQALIDDFSAIDNDSVTSSVGITLSPEETFTLGVQGTWSQRDYDNGFNNDAAISSLGFFARAPITDFSWIEATAGYHAYDFSSGGLNSDTDQLSDYYASAALRNELNELITQSLIVGRDANFGTLSNFESREYVRYELSVGSGSAMSGGLVFGYRWNDESGPRDARDRTFSLGLHGSYRLTDYFVLGVQGEYTRSDSSLSERDYAERRFQAFARLHVSETTRVNLSYQTWDVSHDATGFVENRVVTGLTVDF